MLELSIGLAVASLVIAAVVQGAQKLVDQANLNKTVSQVSSAADQIRLILKRDPDASALSLKLMTSVGTNAFNLSSIENAGTDKAVVNHALAGQIWVGTSNQYFYIEVRDIPPWSCADLASSLEGLSHTVEIWDGGKYAEVKGPSRAYVGANSRGVCRLGDNNYIKFWFLK